MSQNHIDIKYSSYKGKDVKLKDIRFRNGNTQILDLMKAITDLSEDLRNLKADYDGLKAHYNDDNVFKSNKLITAIQRTTEATSTTIIQGVETGVISGGGSTTTDNITTVSVSLTGGVAAPQIFSSPAQLLGVPISYATIDGMVSAEVLVPTSLTVIGFTIQSLQDSVAIYSYKTL